MTPVYKRNVAIPTAHGEQVFTVKSDAEHAAHLHRVSVVVPAPYPDEDRLEMLPIHEEAVRRLLQRERKHTFTCSADFRTKVWDRVMWRDTEFMKAGLGCTIGFSPAQIERYSKARRAGK
jgi:hypothetical protein